MVLKLSIPTLALPWRQRSDWGLRVTQDAYFSLLSHTKQLLLVTFSDTTAGIGASFRTDARTDGGGRTDRRGSRNSYLDYVVPIDLGSEKSRQQSDFTTCINKDLDQFPYYALDPVTS